MLAGTIKKEEQVYGKLHFSNGSGNNGSRGVIYDEKGKIVAFDYEEYEQFFPNSAGGSRVERRYGRLH